MIYRDFKGLKLSALGMVMMRLPIVGGDYSKVDRDALREMVAYALEKGVNYFDTAWFYHGGDSEKAAVLAIKDVETAYNTILEKMVEMQITL
jgi:predicted aldo/keto reductase-like oxidoreductase